MNNGKTSKYNDLQVDLLLEVCIGEIILGEKFLTGKVATIKENINDLVKHLEKVRATETQKDDYNFYLKEAAIHLNLVGLKLNHRFVTRNEDIFKIAQNLVFEA